VKITFIGKCTVRLFGKPKKDEAPQSIDEALAEANNEVHTREETLAAKKADIKKATKDAAKEAKVLKRIKQENAAAQRFGDLAANPKKALRKVQRDEWAHAYIITLTTAAALSFTAQFTDIDERATQSIKDKYQTIMSIFSEAIQSGTSEAATQYAPLTQSIRPAPRPNAIDQALMEAMQAGPAGN